MSWELPETWIWTTMGSVSEVIGGGTPRTSDPSNFEGGDVPWITPADLSGFSGKYISRGSRSITKKGLASSSAKLMPRGTVLLSSRAPIGYVAIASNPISTNQGFKSFVLPPSVDSDYIYYYLKGARRLVVELASGTTFQEISGSQAKKVPVPIAPLPEQHRIVEAIESYLTRLDDAVASLERVQRNLERCRASVLKAAVEGRMVPTEAELARREGRDYEPAGELLKRILAERKRRWIEDAAEKARAKAEEKARRAGKPWTPDDDARTLQKAHKDAEAKYVEPTPPDTTGLPDLPEGWCWVSASQLGLVTGGITKNPKRESLPVRVPYLRVANVYADELRLDDVESIGVQDDEFTRTVLQQGDLLVVEGNGSVEQIGRVAVWDGRIEGCCHQNHLIKVRLVTPELARWVLSWLLSSSGRMHIMRVASSTSGLHTLSISKVSALPIPLPPLREALRAILEGDRQARLARSISGTLEKGHGRAASLRQSILKWAFEGKLVEQYPDDEPASDLLERIKAERDKTTAGNKGGKRRCRS